MAGRMGGKPLNDTGHVLLKAAWNGKVQRTSTGFTSILEVVYDAGGDHDKGARRGVNPVAIYQEWRCGHCLEL
jgi:hypothetical protein